MKHILIALVLIAAWSVWPSQAAEHMNAKDYIYQSLECSSYFFIAAGGLKKPGNTFNPTLAATYDKHAGMLMDFGRTVGNGIGMTQETFELIMEQSFVGLQKMMSYNYSNFALLQQKYAEPCKEFAELVFQAIQQSSREE